MDEKKSASKLDIKILGPGCKNCVTLADNTKEAVNQMGLDADIDKITDFAVIAGYGVMSTPGLVINGKVVSFGKVLKPNDIKKILEKDNLVRHALNGLKTNGVSLLDIDFKRYASMMKALGDESRIKIFNMLSEGELCACKVLEEFNITQPTLSYHMKILCDCGLVNGRRDGIWMRYTINREAYDQLKGFIDNVEPSEESVECSACSR